MFIHSPIKYVHPLINSFVRKLVCQSIHLFIQLCTYFLGNATHSNCFLFKYNLVSNNFFPLIHLSTHSPIHPSTHSFIYPPIYPPIHPHSSIYPPIHQPIHLSAHSPIHPPVRPSNRTSILGSSINPSPRQKQGSSVRPWQSKQSKMAQPDLDYMAPEVQLMTSKYVTPLCDVFSVAMVICAVFNDGQSLVQANYSHSAYVKQMDQVGCCC